MSHIKILSDEVVAAISAGEVVERPLSVVKELVENSIDAGATRIEVTIEKGGKSYIKVRDNGSGMSMEDLKLCLYKHATSKISTREDLFNIKTMGFRGEALYSISKVSDLSITTKRHDDITGYKLTAKGGRILSVIDQGTQNGTTVEVSNLFYNVPVRKKFLKSDSWEKTLITEYIEQAALTYPYISFFLNADRKNLLTLATCNSKTERVKQLFPELINSLMESKVLIDNYEGEAYLSLPNIELQNFQLFSVNNRIVKDRIFFKAIQDFFSSQRKKSPFIFVSLHIPEDELDVNVHPAKREVKFRDNNKIYTVIRQLFEKASFNLPEKEGLYITRKLFTISSPKPEFRIEEPQRIFVQTMWEEKPDHKASPVKDFRVIGSFGTGFLLIEKDKSLFIIDQHAAHERLLFDRLMAEYEKKTVRPQMVIPYVFSPKKGSVELLEELKAPLAELGFVFEPAAPSSYALVSLPPHISYETGIKTFLELMEDKDCLKLSKDLAYKAIASLACKEAVKKSDPLTADEINNLLTEAVNYNKPYCPHGRNFIVEITMEELEKRFGRKD